MGWLMIICCGCGILWYLGKSCVCMCWDGWFGLSDVLLVEFVEMLFVECFGVVGVLFWYYGNLLVE